MALGISFHYRQGDQAKLSDSMEGMDKFCQNYDQKSVDQGNLLWT